MSSSHLSGVYFLHSQVEPKGPVIQKPGIAGPSACYIREAVSPQVVSHTCPFTSPAIYQTLGTLTDFVINVLKFAEKCALSLK